MLAARKLVRGGILGELKMISILQTNFSSGLYYGKQWRDLVKGIRNATESTTAYVEPGRTSYSRPAFPAADKSTVRPRTRRCI